MRAGIFNNQARTEGLNKAFIKQRLSWIMASYPSANPSRPTLQSVNDFLLTSKSWFQAKSTESSAVSKAKTPLATLFVSLDGEWHMRRVIKSFLAAGLDGDVNGQAVFQSRQPTNPAVIAEYLYVETGTFLTSVGTSMIVSRRWIWQLSAKAGEDSISVHFVKADDETEDYMYHVLDFKEKRSTDRSLQAHGDHFCQPDTYTTTYSFELDDRGAQSAPDTFSVKHVVKGPSKDYVSTTVYSRSLPR